MKKLICIALVLSLVFALAACGGTDSKREIGKFETNEKGIAKDVKIALIGSASGGSFWTNIENGFNDAIKEYGWTGVYWAPSDGSGDAGILQLAETALTQGYDVIVPVINDASIFEDFLKRAKEQGVLVLAYNSDPGEDVVVAQVGIDSYNSGKQQGEMIAKYAKEWGLDEIVGIDMRSSLSMQPQANTHQGILDGIAANYTGKVTEVGQAASEDNAATAQDNISALFIANPNINAIFCADAYSTVGAASYIEEQGLNNKVLVFGLALDAEAFLRVRAGSLIATSSVDSYSMGGSQLLSVVNAILTGGKYVYKNFPDKIWVEKDGIDAYCAEHGITLN